MTTPCNDYDHTKGLASITQQIDEQRRKVELETARLQALLLKQEKAVPRTVDRE